MPILPEYCSQRVHDSDSYHQRICDAWLGLQSAWLRLPHVPYGVWSALQKGDWGAARRCRPDRFRLSPTPKTGWHRLRLPHHRFWLCSETYASGFRLKTQDDVVHVFCMQRDCPVEPGLHTHRAVEITLCVLLQNQRLPGV